MAAAIILPNVTTATPDAQQTQHILTETPEQAKAEIKQSIDASMTILGTGLGITELYLAGSKVINDFQRNLSDISKMKLPSNGGDPENFITEGENLASQESFASQMEDAEARRYNQYWQNLSDKRAPVQSSPYNTYYRYESNGDIHQVTTYDEYGRRSSQYDFYDEHGNPFEHYHRFTGYGPGCSDGQRSGETPY